VLLEDIGKLKNPVTSSAIDPAAFHFLEAFVGFRIESLNRFWRISSRLNQQYAGTAYASILRL
jgi:hypothetical protein